MKGYCLIALLSLLGISGIKAQFSITAVQPPAQFVYEDLWHLSVSGPSSSNYVEFYISLRIFDDQNNLQVKSNSSAFAFSYLPLYVNKTNLGPLPTFQTLYYNSTLLQSVIQSGGYFPAGTYNVQFILFGRPTDGEFTELNDYNYQVVIEAMWPPMLLTPYDEDTIDTPYPLLTWTPAYVGGSQQILYDLNLVEMNPNQSPYMAITSNPSYFNQTGLPGTVLPYPASATALQLDHRYAWQVAAIVNGQPVAYSQVWSFVYAVPQHKPNHQAKQYGEVKRQLSGSYYTIKDALLNFVFKEYYSPDDSLFRYTIYDRRNEVVANQNMLGKPVRTGHNKYSISLCADGLLLQEGVYLLEALNEKNDKYYLRFKVDNTANPCNY